MKKTNIPEGYNKETLEEMGITDIDDLDITKHLSKEEIEKMDGWDIIEYFGVMTLPRSKNEPVYNVRAAIAYKREKGIPDNIPLTPEELKQFEIPSKME